MTKMTESAKNLAKLSRINDCSIYHMVWLDRVLVMRTGRLLILLVIDMNDFHLKVNTSFTHEITVGLLVSLSAMLRASSL